MIFSRARPFTANVVKDEPWTVGGPVRESLLRHLVPVTTSPDTGRGARFHRPRRAVSRPPRPARVSSLDPCDGGRGLDVRNPFAPLHATYARTHARLAFSGLLFVRLFSRRFFFFCLRSPPRPSGRLQRAGAIGIDSQRSDIR